MHQWRWVEMLALVFGFLLTSVIAGWAQQPRLLDVVIVLDQSGSMQENDPQRLMEQVVSHFIGQLGPNDGAGLVLFGTKAAAVQPLGPLATGRQREILLAQIRKIQYNDAHTNIAAGIERGLYELKVRGREGSARALAFVTDGIMDTGSSAKDSEMKRWLRQQLLPDARQRGVRIFSIALTEQADFTLIQEMARVTGGDYFRAMSAPELAGIFKKVTTTLRKRLETPAPVKRPPPRGNVLPWIAGGIILGLLLIVIILIRRSQQVAPQVATPSPPPSIQETPLPPAKLVDLKTGQSIPISKPIMRIGRTPENDIVIPQDTVSASHAIVEYSEGQFFLEDTRSGNGTFLNKQRLQIGKKHLLKSGDILRFDVFGYTFMGPEPIVGGTMIREDRRESGGTVVREPENPPTEPPRKTLVLNEDSESAKADQEVTVKCPTHLSVDATERCSKCQKLWCGACIQVVGDAVLCSECRKAAT